ncbi:MAG: hypothetical protein R2695_15755 [Acidimicrobiales bacterium]
MTPAGPATVDEVKASLVQIVEAMTEFVDTIRAIVDRDDSQEATDTATS